MLILGLTGSIGMGKTTTAGLFRDEGILVFDADAAVHALYLGDAAAAVHAAFPGVAPAGPIDRDLLGERVLGDAAALTRLEAIVHPLVRRERDRFLRRAERTGASVAVLDVPLLYETGSDSRVDAVVVVSAPETVQKARVLARPGMTEDRFAAMMRRQLPDREKRRRARFIIDTGNGIEDARAQVRSILASLRQDLGREGTD